MALIRLPIADRRRLAGLWRECDAAVLMEYAFVGPAFIALLLAIVNVALVYLAQESLETAALSASRMVLTGKVQTTTLANGHVGMDATDFKNVICHGGTGVDSAGNAVTFGELLPPMLKCANLTVNVATASTYNVASTTAPTFKYDSKGNLVSTGTGYSYQSGASGQNKIVVLQLVYLWPTSKTPFGMFNLSNQPNSNRMLVATSVFTTESFNCAATQATC